MIELDDGFLLTTLSSIEDVRQPFTGFGKTVGYGASFAPVRHASPSEIVGLISPFLSERLTATPDDARGAILLQGPRPDVENAIAAIETFDTPHLVCLLYTSPSPRDRTRSRMPSSA